MGNGGIQFMWQVFNHLSSVSIRAWLLTFLRFVVNIYADGSVLHIQASLSRVVYYEVVILFVTPRQPEVHHLERRAGIIIESATPSVAAICRESS